MGKAVLKAQYANNKEVARQIIKERLEYFNDFYKFEYKRVAIKNHKTRWGSCSEKKNLNFNYRVAFLEPHLRDYVIIHELCHLREFNHGPKFWQLVALRAPEYLHTRRELYQIRLR
jgi:predicted metal-dependent hydrolase